MFRVHGIVPAVVVVIAGLSLSGCGSSSGQFDPTTWLDFEFTKKPPLPGERKAVFPEGVPGVPEGVPKELVKGNQPPPLEETAVAPVEAAPPPKPARTASRPAPNPRTASAPPRPAPAHPAATPRPAAAQPSPAPWPDPAPVQAAPKPAAPAWPEPNVQANWPPPDPNTFSR
jgi:hypothetical protein